MTDKRQPLTKVSDADATEESVLLVPKSRLTEFEDGVKSLLKAGKAARAEYLYAQQAEKGFASSVWARAVYGFVIKEFGRENEARSRIKEAIFLLFRNENKEEVELTINAISKYIDMADVIDIVSELEGENQRLKAELEEAQRKNAELAAENLRLQAKLAATEAGDHTSPISFLLPDKAPKLYAERTKGQNIIDFLRDPEGWGPYVAAGVLTRPDLRRLDPPGEMALRNWLRTHDLPADIPIPTKSEILDILASDDARVKAARRLVHAHDRRKGVSVAKANTLVLPDQAPKLYAERTKGQNIIDFLRDPEGWGPYVAAGALTRPDLRRLDPQAYTALANWLRSNELPSDLVVPTKRESVDAELADPARMKDVWRLRAAHHRRRTGPT